MNTFLDNPVQVVVLGVDLDKKLFNIKYTIAFTGEVPKDVERALHETKKILDKSSKNTANISNPILSKFYGPNWKEKLGITNTITKIGGLGSYNDDDNLLEIGDVDNLKDIDLADDIFDIEIQKPSEKPSEKPSKKESKKSEKIEKLKDKKSKEIEKLENLDSIKVSQVENLELTTNVMFVKDICVYPEDKVIEFKEKIYALFSTLGEPKPIYRQHICIKAQGRSIPIRYNITADGDMPIDILDIFNPNNKYVADIPIDYELFMNREAISVQAFDTATTLADIYKTYGTVKFYLIDINDFIGQKKGVIDGLLKNDKQQFRMLYYGFVLKFWPMMTEEVYKDYITNEADMYNLYSDLVPNPKRILSRIQLEKEVFQYKYNLLQDAWNGFRNNPRFKLYSPMLLSEMSTSQYPKRKTDEQLIKVSIRNSTLTIDKSKSFVRGRIEYFTQMTRIDVRNLLYEVEISDTIPLVRAKIVHEGNPMEVTKKRSTKAKGFMKPGEEDIQRIYESIKGSIRLVYYNTAMIVVKIPNKILDKYKISYEDNFSKYMVLTIFDNGKYNVKSIWEENTELTFQNIFHMTKETIDPVISYLNNLGNNVFSGIGRLSFVEKSNSEFTDLTVNIFWKKAITKGLFDKVKELFQNDIRSGIIKKSDTPDEYGTVHLLFTKGITEFDLSSIEKAKPGNYYQYLSDGKFKQKWSNVFENGREISINHRTTDLKIEAHGMKEKEFTIFYTYVISKLYQLEFEKDTKVTEDESDKTKVKRKGTQALKLLKSKDPEAFDFKKYGSPLVYSRICQKKLQPIPYSEQELMKLPAKEKEKAVKYWNFTTQEPMWYICPNVKFPYLSFIPKQHPKGYCLPCCKKTPAFEYSSDKKVPTKKSEVYNVCMKEHVYLEGKDAESDNEDEFISRYIMNYGKPVELGRIGRLPDLVEKYLLYNLEDVSDKEVILDIYYVLNGKRYNIDKIVKASKNIKIRAIPVKEYDSYMNLSKFKGVKKGEFYTGNEILKNPALSPSGNRIISQSNPEEAILIYKSKDTNFQEIIHGYHILAKAIMDKLPTVNVKIITDKLLVKVPSKNIGISDETDSSKKNSKIPKLPKSTKEGGGRNIDIHKYGYYLYGVNQNHPNINDVGAIYSLASVFGLNFNDFIKKVVKDLTSNKNMSEYYFNILLSGLLPLYFENMQHLISTIVFLFVGGPKLKDEGKVYKFAQWNELFIHIVQIFYKKIVITLKDNTINTSGTSIKTVDINENIDVILYNKVDHIDDLIADNVEYILLLKRVASRGDELQSSLYYPIYVFLPQNFFKSGSMEKKTYNSNDEIIKLIQNILMPSLTKNKEIIDLRTIIDFIKPLDSAQKAKDKKSIIYKIVRLYINRKNLCYAVLLINEKNKFIYIPINYSSYSDLDDTKKKHEFIDDKVGNNLLSYTPFNKSKYKLNFEDVKKFMSDYNTYVVNLSESKGMFKVVVEDISKLKGMESKEAKIIPVLPLMKISNILLETTWGSPKDSKNIKVVGFICNNMTYYVDEIDAKKFKEIASKDYSVLIEPYNLDKSDKTQNEQTLEKYIFYDPNKINEAIFNSKSAKTNNFDKKGTKKLTNTNVARALYNKYNYQLFTLELMGFFDRERNIQIRKKISLLISKTNFTDQTKLERFWKDLDELIGEFPDYETIKTQVNLFYSTYFDKKKLIDSIEKNRYHFDKTTLIKLKELTTDYMAKDISERVQIKKECIKILNDIVPSVIETKSKLNDSDLDGTVPNILTSCNDKSNQFCKKNKLIIDETKIDNYVSMFFEDFVNPLKKPYIMSSISIKSTIDFLNFRLNPGEDIFVRYNL